MNEVSTIGTATGEKPALQTPEQHRFLTILTNAIEVTPGGKCFISQELAPTEGDRWALVDRREELRGGIVAAPASRESGAILLKRIIDMFDAWPTVRMDADKAMGVARTYATQVEALPLWAIDAGILSCQSRKTPFPPSAGEFKAACVEKLAPMQDEITTLSKVLDAEVYVPDAGKAKEAVARVKAVADDMKRRSGAFTPFKASDYREHPDAEAERSLAEFDTRRKLDVNHDKPLTVSMDLKAILEKGRG